MAVGAYDATMPLTRLDHYNVSTSKPEETLRFYCEGLGMVNDPSRRPDFPVPGAWLFIGDAPLVHVVFVDEDPGDPTGPLDHVAFDATDRDGICELLDGVGAQYKIVEHPSGAFSQVFVRDPNGVLVEINVKG